MDSTPTGNEVEAYLRSRRNDRLDGNRLHPIVGPQWNLGILQSQDDERLYAAAWQTCPDGSREFLELTPVPEDLLIADEYDGGQAQLWTDWHVVVLRLLDEAGDAAPDQAARMSNDGNWIVLAAHTVATNTYLPVVMPSDWPTLYQF
jgi:hypothetical protein